jgi:uncharacterized integral membrane protein
VATSDPTQVSAQKRSRRELARTGALVLLAVLMTLFAVLNVEEVQVNWIFGKSSTPLIIVIVVSLLAGILFGYVAELLYRRRKD